MHIVSNSFLESHYQKLTNLTKFLRKNSSTATLKSQSFNAWTNYCVEKQSTGNSFNIPGHLSCHTCRGTKSWRALTSISRHNCISPVWLLSSSMVKLIECSTHLHVKQIRVNISATEVSIITSFWGAQFFLHKWDTQMTTYQINKYEKKLLEINLEASKT